MEETGLQIWNATSPWMEALAGFVFTVALPFLLREFFGWLKSKHHSAAFACAMEKAERMVLLGVQVTEQTFVREIKAKKEGDGHLTPEEGKEALKLAGEHALNSLGEKQLREMSGCLKLPRKELPALLERMAEAAVKNGG